MIQWKQLEEAPDYWVSNRGEFLSKRVEGKEMILKVHKNHKTGYLQQGLVISGKGEPRRTKTFYPHVLVAKYFCENPNGYDRVHHKDHNKHNNHYWNLEWVSQEQNIHEYYNSDEPNKPRNMRPVEVWTVKGDYVGTYPSMNKAGKELGISPTTVWRQLSGRAKSGRKYIFKYEEK
jgi:hypothetical protein